MLDRDSLKLLKRKELQKMAMGFGIKANLKSNEMIDILLERFPAGVPTTRRRAVASPTSEQIPEYLGNVSESASTSRPKASVPAPPVTMQFDATQGRFVVIPNSKPNSVRDTRVVADAAAPLPAPYQHTQHPHSLAVFSMATQRSHQYHMPQAPRAFHPSSLVASASHTLPWNGVSATGYRLQYLPANQLPGYASTNVCSYSYPPVPPAPQPSLHLNVPPHVPSSISPATKPRLTQAYLDGLARPDSPSPSTSFTHLAQDNSGLACDGSSSSGAESSGSDSDSQVANWQIDTAAEEAIRDAVEKLAAARKFQDFCQGVLDEQSAENERMKGDLGDINKMILQEDARYRRMRVYLDTVQPRLYPRWREEVIWDKACPTYSDEDGNHLEYDTDDERAPKEPVSMVKWYRMDSDTEESRPNEGNRETAGEHSQRPQSRQASVARSDTSPRTNGLPKRRRADENETPSRTPAKRVRRSGSAVVDTPRVTRSAAKKKALNRELVGIAEEDEERQDMISVLSILSQPVDRSDTGSD